MNLGPPEDEQTTSSGPWPLVEEGESSTRISVSLYRNSTVNTLIMGTILLLFDEAASAWATYGLAASYAVISLLQLRSRRRPGEATLQTATFRLGMAATTVSFANHLAVHVLLGGYANSGAWFLFGVVVTALVPLWASKRVTVAIGVLYGSTAVVLGFAEPALNATRQAIDPTLPAILFPYRMITSMVLLTGIIYMTVTQIAAERGRSESLLLNLLPESIAHRLKASPRGTIADEIAECTVVFADIVGFTPHSLEVSPQQLVEELNELFSQFDRIAARYRLQKIKTMGDGYMAVAGAPEPDPDHLGRACDFALELRQSITASPHELEMRIGLSTGPVVGGVIGEDRLTYDIWGETVNLASRLETHGQSGQITVSETVYERGRASYQFHPAGTIEMKGLGPTPVFLLIGRSPPSTTNVN